MKVDFLICGAQKAGTTALHDYLSVHPEVFMVKRKEAHFFDFERFFQTAQVDYSIYHTLFDPVPPQRVLGESTPIYMYWKAAPKRIWQYNPDMKLIVVLRNPIERAYSHWNMEYARKADTLPFWEALQSETQRCSAALPFQHRVFSYVDRGLYSEQLQRLWAYFPKTQVQVLKSEDLRDKPKETMGKVTGFLGVSPPKTIDAKEIHTGEYSSRMSEREREYLRTVFKPEIHNLEQLLGWDCSKWLE